MQILGLFALFRFLMWLTFSRLLWIIGLFPMWFYVVDPIANILCWEPSVEETVIPSERIYIVDAYNHVSSPAINDFRIDVPLLQTMVFSKYERPFHVVAMLCRVNNEQKSSWWFTALTVTATGHSVHGNIASDIIPAAGRSFGKLDANGLQIDFVSTNPFDQFEQWSDHFSCEAYESMQAAIVDGKTRFQLNFDRYGTVIGGPYYHSSTKVQAEYIPLVPTTSPPVIVHPPATPVVVTKPAADPDPEPGAWSIWNILIAIFSISVLIGICWKKPTTIVPSSHQR